ncbi:unnamed protein product, partial [Iphiclides podalirius]
MKLKNPLGLFALGELRWMLGGCSGRAMSNQAGMKHVPTEPAQLENKRSRRRAGGRAAALRRAPSDSDCSGETASLSADSAERAPRAPPVPTRQTKSRSSRRRGSEWEVLEGLKDGQRFEKRPEVFNGYLHKKRKWPLKGWHKRFFVVDGGILVYARSPSDVARGRLHGSVDVGLSVISAKARRRRVDIDADEFIYHLRAKTPDAFRTWLNVLKAHRLYRQHLLTFGARESVPKIHAPSEDHQPPETSSQSISRTESSVGGKYIDSQSTWPSSIMPPSSPTTQRRNSPKAYPHKNLQRDDIAPLKTLKRREKSPNILVHKHGSLCSMNCLARAMDCKKRHENNNFNPIVPKANGREEMVPHSTNLDVRTGSTCLESLLCAHSLNSERRIPKNTEPERDRAMRQTRSDEKRALGVGNAAVTQTEPVVYCFTHKPRSKTTNTDQPQLKRSRKSTNMVKYRNSSIEPRLRKPLSKCMLLGKYKLKVSRHSDAMPASVVRATKSNELAKCDKKGKRLGEVGTDVDRVTDKLIETVFESYRKTDRRSCEDHLRSFIDQVVTELYCFSCQQSADHPVKALFKCLLEYWIRNASFESLGGRVKEVNKHSTRDQNTSSLCVHNFSKGTQFEEYFDALSKRKSKQSIETSLLMRSGLVGADSSDRERRIQELERILNNTVYYCENANTAKSRENDIRITKALIENIGKKSLTDTPSHKLLDHKIPSELPKLQKTIDNFLDEASIPPDMAKDILSAYLNILTEASGNDASRSLSPKFVEESPQKYEAKTECVHKKVSRCVMTQKCDENKQPVQNTEAVADSGRIYLNDILNKITTEPDNVYLRSNSKVKRITNTVHKYRRIVKEKSETSAEKTSKGNPKETYKRNNVVIYLSKYNLDRISSTKHPLMNKIMSVSINIESKSSKFEGEASKVDLKWTDKGMNQYQYGRVPDIWQSNINKRMSDSEEIFRSVYGPSGSRIANNYLDFYWDEPTENINIKPFFSSGATSKICLTDLHNSEFRILTVNNSNPTGRNANAVRKSCKLLHDPQYEGSPIKETIPHNKYLQDIAKSSKAHIIPPPLDDNKPVPQEDGIPQGFNEQLIVLLLNNLATVYECIPALHRDVYILYRKLFKEFGQSVKSFEEFDSFTNEVGIQCTDLIRNVKSKSADAETNTINFSTLLKNNIRIYEKTQISLSPMKQVTHVALQTEEENRMEHAKYTSSKSVSNQNCYRQLCTRDISINTAIKLKEFGRTNRIGVPFAIKRKSPIRNVSKPCGALKNSIPRRNIVRQLPILAYSPKSYVINNSLLLKDKLSKDYNVYQLFLSNKFAVKGSSSLIDNRAKLRSSGDLKTLYRCSSDRSFFSGLVSPAGAPLRGPQAGFVSGTPGGRLAGWIIDSGGPLESASRDLGQAQLSVQQLQRLLDALEMQQVHHDTDVSLEGASPNVKKDRRKFGLRKKKSNSKCASVELQPPHMDPSNSHMALSALTAPPSPGGGSSSIPNSAASLPIACAATRPQSLPGAEALGGTAGGASLVSLTPDHQLREDFAVLAKDLVASLKGIVATLVCERGRIRAAAEAGEAAGGAALAALRSNLSTALHQNSELRSRLSRIHDASDLAEISSMGPSEQNRQFQRSLSYSSSCVSASEFFDAEEHEEKPAEILGADEAGVIELDGDSSSEAGSLSSEEGSASSDNSEAAMVTAEPVSLHLTANGSAGGDTGVGVGVGAAVGERGPGQPHGWARRTRLPSPRPTPGGPSLWNLLYKNIGKDIGQIRPGKYHDPREAFTPEGWQHHCLKHVIEVHPSHYVDWPPESWHLYLNDVIEVHPRTDVAPSAQPTTCQGAHGATLAPWHPSGKLETFQNERRPPLHVNRLCEELEYCSLLDAACQCGEAGERAALVAAFAVSAYAASAHRAASKPFNPLLHETYECVRPDRGFRFLAEQVSHHPPISACHAESQNWTFWQEARIRTKFWGKSMEFQPAGRVHVRLKPTGDHYSWNKVTTCVHNLFGGQRWVDQYGDMHLTCHGTDVSCKLNFVKASSWSGSRHEVRGAVACGGARLRLAGRWSEALSAGDPPAARCLWRPGAMPPDHELYYGFTRFAMELNELEPGMKDVLPHTDTRLRPDQRALEEGDVESAERLKLQLEQAQRERRRDQPDRPPAWFRKVCEGGEEMWLFTGEYWKAREAGFPELDAPLICACRSTRCSASGRPPLPRFAIDKCFTILALTCCVDCERLVPAELRTQGRDCRVLFPVHFNVKFNINEEFGKLIVLLCIEKPKLTVCRMSSASVNVKFRWGLTPSDPEQQPVLIVGQAVHLNTLSWQNVRCKLEPRVSEEVWQRGLGVVAAGEACELWPRGASLAALPARRSRHAAPSRAHALSKIVRAAQRTSAAEEFIVLVCRKRDVLASAVGIARAVPQFSARSGSAPLGTAPQAPAPSRRDLTVEIVLVADDRREGDSDDEGVGSLDPVLLETTLNDDELSTIQRVADMTRLAARITDTPANLFHVDDFVEEACKLAKELDIAEPTVIRGEALREKGMGGLYGVGRGAARPPALVSLTYEGAGATGGVAWVGKGIVYDTGGLSIKSRSAMVGMKGDCGGAAAVLGAFGALVRQKPKMRLHAVLCLAENSVGPDATRPDDIHQLYSGRTVEINNTDAEGRLVLSDGVVYAQRDLKADTIVDIATLTGAQGTATGKYHAAAVCNSARLERRCVAAGAASGDLVHPLPFAPELHFPEFSSVVADMKNSVAERNNAQPSCAGLFILSHLGFDFRGEWLHIDMASPAHSGERATGYGVALLNVLFGGHSNSRLLRALSPGDLTD